MLRSVVRYITSTSGTRAYTVCAKRLGFSSHTFLENNRFVIIYDRLYTVQHSTVPTQRGEEPILLATPPAEIPYNGYKIEHDTTTAITAKLCKMSMPKTKCIFGVRIGRVSVRASPNYTSRILTGEDIKQLSENFMEMRQKLALGDAGATHSLITSRTARQIKA